MSQAVTGLVKRPIKVTIRRQDETLMEQIFQTTPIRIGRMLDNDLALPFDFISRYHCELRFENETWNAYDLGSKNGFLIESSAGNQVRLERINELKLEDGSSFFIQELNVSLEFMDPIDFTQSFQSQGRTDTLVEEETGDSHTGPRPMVEVDLQNLMFVPHSSTLLAKERSLQVTTVWHDQVLDSKEFAVGDMITWEFNGLEIELGRVGKDKAAIRIPNGCKPVEGAELIGNEKAKKKTPTIQASLTTPTAFNVSETLFVYIRYIPKSRALPMTARLIDEKMMDPLMFSTAVHGTAALTALVLGGKAHAPEKKPADPERFATIIMPQQTPVPTPEPVQVAVQPTPEPTPEPTPLPVPEKPKPKKIAKVDPPKELPKPKKVVKEVVKKRAIAKQEEPSPVKEDTPKPVEKVAKVEPPKPKQEPVLAKVASLPPEKAPPAVGTPAPPAATPQPFNAKSVGALKAFALLKAGPTTVNLSNVEKIQVSRSPSSVPGSVIGATAVQGTGEILTQLNQSASGGGSGPGDGAGGVAVGGKSAGGEYKVAGLGGKAGNRKIKGSVLGGATYTELSKNDGLTREQVMKEVTRHQSEIQRCYEEALMFNPDISGNAEYEWEISPKGPVTLVKVKSATLKNGEKLLDCVKNVFVKMQFPKSKNGESTNSTINLPFGRL